MIEEDLKSLQDKVEQLEIVISYIVDAQMPGVRFEHLTWCRNKDQNLVSCSCGARTLNYLVGR